jgi:hypothetical protein
VKEKLSVSMGIFCLLAGVYVSFVTGDIKITANGYSTREDTVCFLVHRDKIKYASPAEVQD